MSKGGREILRILVLSALVGGWAQATAQSPPDSGQVEPCDPATEPCEERVPALETVEAPSTDPSSETAEAGIEAAVEEDPVAGEVDPLGPLRRAARGAGAAGW